MFELRLVHAGSLLGLFPVLTVFQCSGTRAGSRTNRGALNDFLALVAGNRTNRGAARCANRGALSNGTRGAGRIRWIVR